MQLDVRQWESPAGPGGRRSARPGWGQVLLAAALWGTTGLIFKMLESTSRTNALSISFLRLALSVPFLLAGARVWLGRFLVRLTARGALSIAGLGASMALYQLTYVLAIERVGVAVAVLISICGAPVIIGLITVMFLGERFHPRIALSLIASVVGTILLVGFPDPDLWASERFGEGVATALACAVFQALYVLAARAAGRCAHPMHSGGIGFALGAALLLPFAALDGLELRYPAEGWLMLLYIASVPTALAQTLFLMGLKTTGALGGAIASLLEPLVSTALAVWLLGEQLGPIGYLGAAVLLAGIVIAQGERPASWNPSHDRSGSDPEPATRPRPTIEAVRADWKERLPGWFQPFLTWLAGYPYVGQKPMFRNTPWWMAIAVPAVVLAVGLALSAVIVDQGGYALFVLPGAWLMVVHGARTLQVHICHQGIHGNLSGDPAKDRFLVEVVSTALAVQGHDGYKSDHDAIHHPRLASRHDPDRQFTVEMMNIEPGARRDDNIKRFHTALISPKIHALFLLGRIRANFVACPPYRRLMSIAWAVLMVAVLVASRKWVEFLVGWVVPMTVLYHMSAMGQFVTEHFWARKRRPGQTAGEHYLSLLVNRHLGDPLPEAGLRSLQWWSGWMTWWTRLFLYHVPVRLAILVADLPVHGSHHLWPHDRRWTDSIYAYRELAERSGKSPVEFVGSYGEILDFVMESFSEAPPESRRVRVGGHQPPCERLCHRPGRDAT